MQECLPTSKPMRVVVHRVGNAFSKEVRLVIICSLQVMLLAWLLHERQRILLGGRSFWDVRLHT